MSRPRPDPSSSDDSVAARLELAAIAAVAEDGLAGLTVEALCARADAGRAAFYRLWSDPWDVLHEALDARMRLPQLPDTGDLVDDLVAYLDAYLERCSDPGFVACLLGVMGQAAFDPGLSERLLADFAARRADNRLLVERAQARGELPSDVDPDSVLDLVLKLGFSWIASGKAPCREAMRPAVERLLAPPGALH